MWEGGPIKTKHGASTECDGCAHAKILRTTAINRDIC
jgi:hypothetical protein